MRPTSVTVSSQTTSSIIPIDWRATNFKVSLGCLISAGANLTYKVQHTFDDIWDVSVTPSTAALGLSLFAPTVTISDHKTVVPGTIALTLTTFVPTVSAGGGVTVVPDKASLALSLFAPTINISDHKIATPGTAALTLTPFAPVVNVGGGNVTVTPGIASLVLTTFAPRVLKDADDVAGIWVLAQGVSGALVGPAGKLLSQ